MLDGPETDINRFRRELIMRKENVFINIIVIIKSNYQIAKNIVSRASVAKVFLAIFLAILSNSIATEI